MFKKFDPKADVSSSTSLKSSVQRNIRNQLIDQIPLLSKPAFRDRSLAEVSSAAPPEAAPAPAAEEDDDDAAGKKSKKGGKGKGAATKKGGKKSGKKDREDDDPAQGDDDSEVTVLDDIWPKKDALGLTKCHDRISIYTVHQRPIFFNHFDGPFIPTLRLLHQYPDLLPHIRVDRGAIKFLLAGANMMAPGLLSAGGHLPEGLQKDALVAIHAEGKVHAAGIGKMTMSSDETRKVAKGVAVEVICWVGDDLWKVQSIGL